jgi:hypothetical protein
MKNWINLVPTTYWKNRIIHVAACYIIPMATWYPIVAWYIAINIPLISY